MIYHTVKPETFATALMICCTVKPMICHTVKPETFATTLMICCTVKPATFASTLLICHTVKPTTFATTLMICQSEKKDNQPQNKVCPYPATLIPQQPRFMANSGDPMTITLSHYIGVLSASVHHHPSLLLPSFDRGSYPKCHPPSAPWVKQQTHILFTSLQDSILETRNCHCT